MTAISTGHCPAGPEKENEQGITEPNLMASDTRRGSPAGSPAVCPRGFLWGSITESGLDSLAGWDHP
jgi:hypothetical protein